MSRCKSQINIIDNFEEIKYKLEIFGLKSFKEKMTEEKEYLLFYKTLTSADIPTKGKHKYKITDKLVPDAFSKKKLEFRANRNIMFYTLAKDMIKYEKKNQDKKLFFCQTKQSNIYMPKEFYDFLGVPKPREKETVDLNTPEIKSYIFMDLVNKYFQKEITNQTLHKLEKSEQAAEIEMADGFVNIDLTTGVHGIGRENNKIFHNIRRNTFVSDRIVILTEKTHDIKNIYIAFIRNPKFFEINGIYNEEYLASFIDKEDISDKQHESRKGQAKWRELLADYYISEQCDSDRVIKCPFTDTKINYEQEGTLLRASHIKSYASCKNAKGEIDIAEAYDINNGFLVTANTDALFDKYMISVEPDSLRIVYSKRISKQLREKIGLLSKLSEEPSDSKRKYLKIHYEEFKRRELKR